MYPIVRFIKEMIIFARASKLALGEVHHSSHICWPWDVDPWMELNNGRTLTLYDLGRIPMAKRSGMVAAVRSNGWGMAVAGATVRYRRRVKMFDRFAMSGAILGWDARFFYFQQSMWKGAEATSSILLRMAITGQNGLVSPAEVARAIGWAETSPELPDYARQWITAEAARPWPPVV